MSASAPAILEKNERSTRKPRVGFLGVGWIGAHRLGAIAKSQTIEIAAIADPVAALVEEASAHAPEARRLSDLDQLLEQELDAVVIATPSALHAAQAIAALERGVAVFCQKPLGRDTAEVRAVIDAAREADRLLGVDLSYRFTKAMQRIRPLVRSGALGKIYAVDLVFHNG
ncbi:MAG TPA: Gfo/Idh/MocA family oxidoreductase, partial [Chthoniobacterales bacterium]|nr:Gfo/Idh/MocA family oxidoreductase [Chthoniobacterales bacterium]